MTIPKYNFFCLLQIFIFLGLRENQKKRRAGRSEDTLPYRNSKITMMFKDFFEGKNGCGTLRMMVCVNPQPDDYDENIYVMDFAEMTSKVKIKYETPIQRTLFTPGKYYTKEVRSKKFHRVLYLFIRFIFTIFGNT